MKPQSLLALLPGFLQRAIGTYDFETVQSAHLHRGDIQKLFQLSDFNSTALVELLLQQIENHNQNGLHLGALISVAPRQQVLARARKLDEERIAGQSRSSLHGIPFIVKDSIATHPDMGMDTTGGSWALAGSRPSMSSPVVERLVDAGMILVGEASLTEFNRNKGAGFFGGWSPIGGYTRSAYVAELRTDQGSIGHSTDGSIVSPASRAALYALKPTVGRISTDGVILVSDSLDSVGAMARSPSDLAAVTQLMMATVPGQSDTNFSDLMTGKWDGIRLGFVDEKIWQLPEGLCHANEEALAEMRSTYHGMMQKLRSLGVHVEYPVELPTGDKVWSGIGDIINYEFSGVMDRYLGSLDASNVRSLEDLVEWNHRHPDKELPPEFPSQSKLESALACNISASDHVATVARMRGVAGSEGIDRILNQYNLDAIVSLSDSPISSVASAAGEF
uniref:Amidase domain-containing protein n=1 Tax=Bionectria ochroleuca TaxID=29856 RepID=A0A8H7N472_BIOOC